MSTQPCGCDLEAVPRHLCDRHLLETLMPPPVVPTESRCFVLPTDPQARKQFPISSGVLDYFPNAIALIAHVSFMGNEQHNPGEPLHWAREKSMDQEDTLLRHHMDRGTFDSDGMLHSAKRAWRALAALELEAEQLHREGKL